MSEIQPDTEFERIRQDLDELQSVVRVISQVNSSLDLQETLQISLEGIRQVVGGEFGGVILIRPDDKVELAHTLALTPSLLTRLENISPLSASTEPYQSDKVPTRLLSQIGQHVSQVLRDDNVGYVLIPLTAREHAVGVLFVGAPAKRILTPPSVNLLMSVGEQVGMAIEHARLHARLRDSEEWHRAFIENSLAAFGESDDQGRMLFVNDTVCKMVGLPREVLLGMRTEEFILYDEETRQSAERALREKGRWVNPHGHLRTARGEIRSISITCRRVRSHDGNSFRYQSVFHDVTEREQLLETLRRRNEEAAALNNIARILSHPLEIQNALDQVCDQIVSVTGMDSAAVCLIDESQQFVYLAAHRGLSAELANQARRLGLDDPITRRIVLEGKVITVNDLRVLDEAGFAGPRAEGYRAGICMPIRKRDLPAGAVFVGSKVQTSYPQSDVDLLQNISNQIGVALENADLYAQMQRRVNELSALADLSAACVSSLDARELSDIAVEWTKKLLRVGGCAVRLFEGETLRLGAAQLVKAGAHAEERIEIDPLIRFVVENRVQFSVDDAEADASLSAAHRESLKAFGVRSIAVAPLPARERVVGIITVAHADRHAWSPQEINLLKTIANLVANAIENALLFQNVISEQRMVKAIFDSGLSGLFAVDAEGQIVMFNRAAERITGWTFAEVRGKKWANLFGEMKAGVPAEPVIEQALARKESAFDLEGRYIKTRDGRVIPVTKAAAPLLDDKDNVTGAVGAFWDRSREQAAEISRERFLEMVAHELRSPLTGLLSALQLLERQGLSKQRRADMWRIVKNDGVRLRKFADDFLDHEAAVKSPRPLQLVPLPIAPFARNLVKHFKGENRSHRFCVRSCKPEPRVSADVDRLENALRNLLDNAVNYSPPGSRITVSISALDGHTVEIAVQDQGDGIPREDRERVFEPFYRSPRSAGRRAYGHGLGLSIARGDVKEMGGEIWVDGNKKRGSTFHITLRRAE